LLETGGKSTNTSHAIKPSACPPGQLFTPKRVSAISVVTSATFSTGIPFNSATFPAIIGI